MYNFNVNDFSFLFFRNLSEAARRSLSDFNTTIYSDQDIIEKVSYDINSHGYRSPKFEKNNEVLVLGCSQTYGSGIPNEFTWPNFFASETNQKYSKVAIQGDSIGAQVYKAFKYFEEIGNPKVVLGLFPLYRLEYLSVPGKFISSTGLRNKEREKPSIGVAFFYEEYLPKISKAPHDPEYIIPKEFVLFYNFMFIKMLEQYCESHGIKFIWSIYDDIDIKDVMQSNERNLKNYLKTSDLLEICHLGKVSECEIDNGAHCGIEFKSNQLYENAADYDISKGWGHFGIHLHKHLAERFVAKYREISND